MKLNARQLRHLKHPEKIPPIKRFPIYFILENIYDTYNIGGLFRLADALAIEKIYLCGETETPPNPKIKKASIGTDKVVCWEYKNSVKEAIEELKSKFSRKIKSSSTEQIPNYKPQSRTTSLQSRQIQNFNNDNYKQNFQITNYQLPITIIAVEQHPNSIPYQKAQYQLPLALIFGNETFGILPETIKLADQIVEIPMFGINKSLNVIVAAAIVSYWLVTKVARFK